MKQKSIEKAIELYEDGFSLRQIEEMICVPYSTIRGWLNSAGVEFRGRGGVGRSGDHKEFQKTALLYQAGYSTIEIAEMLGLNQSSVQYRLEAHGIKLRTKEESVKLRWARQPKRKGYSIQRSPA